MKNMLFDYVKKHWEAGNISVGLPAVGHGNKVYLEGKGLALSLACIFLSKSNRQKIADLSKKEVQENL